MNEGTKPTVRSCVWMYTQQLDHLPFSSIDALVRRIKSISNLDKLAWIVHDKDVNEDGETVTKHIHLAFTLSKRTTVDHLAKFLDDRPEQLNAFTKRGQSVAQSTKNIMGYLVHHTKQARQQNKYQYSLDDVHANFDYHSYVEQTERVKSSKDILDEYANEEITRDQAESLLRLQGGMALARNIKNLDSLDKYILEQRRKRWVSKMKKHGESIKVIWLYGQSGAGKTSFAKNYAQRHDLSYFIATSQNDPFQNYRGQQVLIIDEIRPSTFTYPDLLQICDPYLYGKNLTSRYRNPYFRSDIVFLTSIYSPLAFYNAMHLDTKIDTFEQLNRRLGMVLFFNKSTINQVVFDYKVGTHYWYPTIIDSYNNTYSKAGLNNAFTLNNLNAFGDEIRTKKD